MRTRLILILLLTLMLATLASAANLHGTIYDISLSKINNVIVEINTEPVQKQLAKEGVYAFNVNPGIYKLEVKVPNSNNTIADESITIKKEGNYNLDIFVNENLDSFSNIIEQANNEEITKNLEISNDYSLYLSIAAILLGIILLVFYFHYSKKVTGEKEEIKEIKEEEKQDIDKIVAIIKKEGGRMSQKELRKHFPLSEAKISLMIAELEHKNKIQKIKKGRTNIIILK